MIGQQKGVPKSHALATLSKIGLAPLVEVAYDSPTVSTDEAKAEQRAQFVAASTAYCRDHKEDLFASMEKAEAEQEAEAPQKSGD
ncbi:hypothetical protein V3390_01910 [Luteimonas sp. FXH3W]|uniref:Uncharacterized protein n=1 Tax=Aquilutibacter rugosus TaxID=3115820 RepID=A0ABU7UWT6_9GAMM